MADLRTESEDAGGPRLRREVIVPRARDAAGVHRRIAVLSICVALLAGSLDAMLWRAAQRRAAQQRAATPVIHIVQAPQTVPVCRPDQEAE